MDKAITEAPSGAQVSWTKRVEKPDGSSIRTEVEKIENGYLISVHESKKNSKGEWEYIDKKEFSETNPFDDEKEEKEELSLAEKLDNFIKGSK
jgi:hypothetical protein